MQTAASSQLGLKSAHKVLVKSLDEYYLYCTSLKYHNTYCSVTELDVRQKCLSDVKINDVTYQDSQKTIGIDFTISTKSQLGNTIQSS